MNIKEKIELSKQPNNLTLHREGLFYKCYNENAMVFVQKIKPYKVLSKFVKSAGDDVLSIGFPANELAKGSITIETIENAINGVKSEATEQQLVFTLSDAGFKNNYNVWRNAILEQKKNTTPVKVNEGCQINKELLIHMIQEFDLANSTPMQGLVFIQELKKSVVS